MTTWILCSNLWGARLFRYGMVETGPEEVLRFVKDLPPPPKRTKLENFHDDDETDEIETPIEDPELEKRVAREYMSSVCSQLESAGTRGGYDSLVLCAEEHLLAIMRHCLGDFAKSHLIGTVPQDLYEVNESDLLPYVQDILNTRPARKRNRQPAA